MGQDAYGLVNLRLALSEIPLGTEEYGNLEIAFVANNVANKSYRFGGYGSAGYWYTNVYGDPRFLGGEIIFRWGSKQ